jgi:FixJ family two-component response regulator
MSTVQERILIVESDPDISDLIARQALKPFGYRIKIVEAATQAIQEMALFSPDVIIANINLPGLSGKDLLVAFSSQGIELPVIVMAGEAMENDVIQSFRLGAADYLKTPLREAEIVSAVERALKQVRERRERERLAKTLENTNSELKKRVRDLTTIFNIGKSVTSVTDPHELFERIVKGAVFVTEADMGWLHLRKGNGRSFVLSAVEKAPEFIIAKMGAQWDDGLSSLVSLSGEALSIYGEPLQKFKTARLGRSALVVPVKAQEEVVGVLVVVRKEQLPFDANNQAMLEVVADYISVSLMNVRLFEAVEERARSLQVAEARSQGSERVKADALLSIHRQISDPVIQLIQKLNQIDGDNIANLTGNQVRTMDGMRLQLEKITQILDSISDHDVS